MEKNFDAVNMVREIREKIYEEIKDLSFEEGISYLNNQGKEAERLLKKNTSEKPK